MIDFVGEIRRIMNAGAGETFDQSTDSLEAIRDFIAAMSGGVTLDGEVTAVPGANQFTIPTLAGHGAGAFADAVAPWWALVFRDAGGAGAAPQGEMQPITGYITGTGVFTTAAFTAAVAVGDHIIIVNPILAAIGRRIDGAAADSMANLATDSLVAEVKRALLRMSADAFTATIQGGAVVELDTMMGQMATYFVAVGAAMALQINGNAARTNLQQALTDFAAVFGADNLNVFNPTIQGAVRTDLDAALAAAATYWVAAGAAMALQVNGNAARTNLQQALNDYFAVVGVDGVNVFSTTIQGVARTTIEAAFDGLAAYFVAAGGALSVTIDPGGAARSTLATLWNDLGQMLAGAAGITTWPARSKAADTVSLAEAVRDIDELKPEWAARTSATHTTAGVTEETILTTAYTTPGLFYFNLTLRNMVAGDDFTIRVYKRVNGVAYDLKSEQQFIGAPTIRVYEIEGLYTDGTEFIRVTIQRASGTNRAFPYSYNFIRQPVA